MRTTATIERRKLPVSISGLSLPFRAIVDGAFGASSALPNLRFAALAAIVPARIRYFSASAGLLSMIACDALASCGEMSAWFSVIAGSKVGRAGMLFIGDP